jgi:hypothetical protein
MKNGYKESKGEGVRLALDLDLVAEWSDFVIPLCTLLFLDIQIGC